MNWLVTMSLRISDTFANVLPFATKAQDEESFLPIETSSHIQKRIGHDPGHEVIDLVSIDCRPSNIVPTPAPPPPIFSAQFGRYICCFQVPLPTSRVLAGCTTSLSHSFFARRIGSHRPGLSTHLIRQNFSVHHRSMSAMWVCIFSSHAVNFIINLSSSSLTDCFI